MLFFGAEPAYSCDVNEKNTKEVDTVAINSRHIYKLVFKNYPDILNIKQVSTILGVSKKTVYNLIKKGAFSCIKVGREYRIPKVNVVQYFFSLVDESPEENNFNDS